MNEITIYKIFAVIWIHFISDFALQSNWMAINKSNKLSALGLHCFVYSILFIFFFGLKFAILNGVLHFVIDFTSSKITKYYREKENHHNFFVTIGCDQAIHMSCLIGSMVLLT